MTRKNADPIGTAAIIAARNEADSIAATIEALVEAMPGIHIVVADDASDDGTGEAAMAAGATVVSRRRPHGKGGNVTAAAEALLSDESFDGDDGVVILADADLGESAAELAILVNAVETGDCDLAVAAFARREGGGFGLAVGYAHDKIEELRGFDAIAPISGQRAMRASTLRSLLPFEGGWGMEIGMTLDALAAGLTVKELELPLSHRATGRTLGGFLHRARQMRDFRRVYRSRRD